MTNYIGGVDIGTVQAVDPILRRSNTEVKTGGGLTYWQNLSSSSTRWAIRGYLKAPTVVQVATLFNLMHGLPVLIDVNDFRAGFITWGRVTEVRPRPSRLGFIFAYDIIINEVPSIGVTYMQTAEAYLHSRSYHSNQRVIDPAVGNYGKTVSAGNRLDWTHEFYVDNDKAGIQTLIVEFQVGDDVNHFEVFGWKAAAWSLIGDWGDGDAWNAVKAWTDEDAQAHNFQVQEGVRGATLAGVGVVSQMLGTTKRVLMEITDMQAQGDPDYVTDYGLDQLLLKVVAKHSLRGTARPFPMITYVDGSLDYGPA